MPHTNRARRAQHFRSIDNSSGSVGGSRVTANVSTTKKNKVDSHQRNGGGGGAYSLQEQNVDGRSDTAGPGTVAVEMVGSGQRQVSKAKGDNRKAPSAKNRIRSLTRLLNKPGIDEGQREHLRAQVEALEKQVSDRERKERERTLALKYHKAKFFDRRRALRHLAQLHRKLNGDLEEGMRLELEERRRSEETDLKYVLYFPKDKRYLSLEKGKAGPPRARRSYDRLLKDALSRGEAAGWAEFQQNLDKFVVSAGGNRSGSGEGGIKHKRGLHTLPVIAQENIWDKEEAREDERVSTSDSESEEKGMGERTERRARKGEGDADSSQGRERKKRREEFDSSAREDSDQSLEEDEEFSGDEGFGAAASDEEDAYSFAEARMKWEGGWGGDGSGDGGGKRSSVEGGVSDGREGSGDESDERKDERSDSDDSSSVGDIYESSRSPLLSGGAAPIAEQKYRSRNSSGDGSQDRSEDDDDDESDYSDDASEAKKGFNGRKGMSGNLTSQQPPPREPLGSDDRASSSSDASEIALNDDFFLEEAGPSGTKAGGGSDAADQGTRGDGKSGSSALRGRGSGRGRSGRGWTKQGRGTRGNGGDPGRGGRGGRGSWRGVGRGRGRGEGRGRNRTTGLGRGAGFRGGDRGGFVRPNKITRFEDDD